MRRHIVVSGYGSSWFWVIDCILEQSTDGSKMRLCCVILSHLVFCRVLVNFERLLLSLKKLEAEIYLLRWRRMGRSRLGYIFYVTLLLVSLYLSDFQRILKVCQLVQVGVDEFPLSRFPTAPILLIWLLVCKTSWRILWTKREVFLQIPGSPVMKISLVSTWTLLFFLLKDKFTLRPLG